MNTSQEEKQKSRTKIQEIKFKIKQHTETQKQFELFI